MKNSFPPTQGDSLVLAGNFLTFYIFLWLVLNACGENSASTGPPTDQDRTPWTRLFGKIAFMDYEGGGSYSLDVLSASLRTTSNIQTGWSRCYTYPAWSPDGRVIAAGQDSVMIFKADSIGSQPERVIARPGSGYCGFPTFSPNGVITYYCQVSQPFATQLWIGDSLFLSRDDIRPTRAAWYPDGSALVIAIQNLNGTSGLFKVDAQTKVMTPLILSQGSYRTTLYEWPEVSPDGSMIAFTKVDYGTTTPMSLWVMHADGSSPRWLTPDGVDDYYPTWSPDGSMVAFVRNNDLHIVNSDGTNVARVTWNHNSWYPSWTR